MALVVTLLFAALGVFIVPKIFKNMEKDILDTNSYADRMSAQVVDSQNCARFKNQFRELGKNATGMNGAFTLAMVQTNEAVNKAGCSK